MTHAAARKVLELEAGATPTEIKAAFRRKAMKCHPDHNPGDSRAAARFRKVDEAYKALQIPEQPQQRKTVQKQSTRTTTSAPVKKKAKITYDGVQYDFSGYWRSQDEMLLQFYEALEAKIRKEHEAYEEERITRIRKQFWAFVQLVFLTIMTMWFIHSLLARFLK